MVRYPGIIHDDPDGFWIEFPDLKGCVTQGDTMEQLMAMAEEALSLYLEDYIESEKELPAASSPQGRNIIYIEPYPEIAIPLTIKELRKQQKLSQTEIAERIGVKYQTYQQIENINKFNATVKTLNKIARALGKRLKIEFVDIDKIPC